MTCHPPVLPPILPSSHVAVHRHGGFLHALQVLAFDQALNLLLDHAHVGPELAAELGQGLGDELGMRELLALSVGVVSRGSR